MYNNIWLYFYYIVVFYKPGLESKPSRFTLKKLEHENTIFHAISEWPSK
ncbi:Uncharacterised protein [Escherichia coli]|nr:Uncharacterised protein [Escherichia coli]